MHIFVSHYSAYHNGETSSSSMAEAAGMDGDQGCVWVVMLQVVKERADIWGHERRPQNKGVGPQNAVVQKVFRISRRQTAEHLNKHGPF